jgi:hypothetical protein
MPPNDRTLGERAFETISKGYRDFVGAKNLPADKRIYMESVIDRRRDPLTEKSFRPDELNIIRDVIMKRYDAIKPKLKEDVAAMRPNAVEALREAAAARNPEARAFHMDRYREITANMQSIQSYLQTGKLSPKLVDWAKQYGVASNIQYEDYDNPSEVNLDSGSTNLSAPGKQTHIGQTLGRFNYSADPSGNINVTDTYDFGLGFLNNKQTANSPVSLTDLFAPKQAAVKYARKYLPESQGRPVNIRINSAAPKTKEPENWFSRTATALGF